MVKKLFIPFLRSLLRNKITSFINIFGLSLGLASCFIIMLFVIGELRMDSFHHNIKNIYRVTLMDEKLRSTSSNITYLFGPAAKEEFPEVADFARLIDLGKIKTKLGNDFVEEGSFLFADPSILNILTFQAIEGDAKKALIGFSNIAISQSIARKYFNNTSAIGKSLRLSIKGEEHIVTVSAVFEDLPPSSSLKINLLGNMEFGRKILLKTVINFGTNEKPTEEPAVWQDAWDQNLFSTLVKLSEGTDAKRLENKINLSFKKHLPKGSNDRFKLQPYKEIYLHSSHIAYDNWAHGKTGNIIIFSTTALLILVIACLNYLILSLAQSEKRAREIGIRKVSGANFSKLLQMVMIESVTFAIISLPIAIGSTELILPLLNSLLDKNLAIEYSENIIFIAGVLAITLLVGVGSGFYIAVYLNKFNPVVILRGKSVKPGVQSRFLKTLVVMQVSIFIALIICSAIIMKQLKFVVNYNPGVNAENVIIIPLNDFSAQTNYNFFRQELEKLPGVQSVTAALLVPPSNARLSMSIPRVDDVSKTARLEALLVDYDFIETLGLTLTEGQSFSKGNTAANEVIINESAIKELGLRETVGTELPFGRVIGVVKDFHIHDLRSKITPAYMVVNKQNYFELAVKTKTDYHIVLQEIEKAWKKINKDVSFESSTLEKKNSETIPGRIQAFGYYCKFYHYCNTNRCPWPLRVIKFYQPSPYQRNWHQKSERRQPHSNDISFLERNFYLDLHSLCDSLSLCMVYNEQVAGKFCLQNHIKLVDFSWCRLISPFGGFTCGKLAGLPIG